MMLYCFIITPQEKVDLKALHEAGFGAAAQRLSDAGPFGRIGGILSRKGGEIRRGPG